MGFFDGAFGGIIQAGAGLLGGMFGQQGQQGTNAQQMAMFDRAQNDQHEQYWQSRADNWQMYRENQNFANTAYQRAMNDMRSAGLNPILAGHLGGSQTPSGMSISSSGSAGIPSLGNPGAALQSGITAAAQAPMVAAQLKQIGAMTEKDSTQGDLNKASEDLVKKQQTRTDQETATSKSAEDLNKAATMNKAVEAVLMHANANSANAIARVNQRVAEDTEQWGDSAISKAIGALVRIIGTGSAKISKEVPNSAVKSFIEGPPKDLRPGVPGSPVFGPTTWWNTPR